MKRKTINPDRPIDSILYDLKERAKELNCLYKIQELLNQPEITMQEICQGIIQALPPGWQYPDICTAEIILQGKIYQAKNYVKSAWSQSANITVQEEVVGKITVLYVEKRPEADEGPFLFEERKLIDTISEQLGFYLLHQQLKEVFRKESIQKRRPKYEWVTILDMLKRTDPDLILRLSRRMVNYLGWHGINKAEKLLDRFGPSPKSRIEFNSNQPFQEQNIKYSLSISNAVFSIASQHLAQNEILENIQKWIMEERSGFLINVLLNSDSSFSDISSAIERYTLLATQGIELNPPREEWFRTSLIRRTLNSQIKFIDVAKHYLSIDDFASLFHRVIYTTNSHGKLGGKSAGLLLAEKILHEVPAGQENYLKIKTPKTWYLTSDCVLFFLTFNNLEDIVEQKYKDLYQIQQEYPYIIHMFKNSKLPPEIIKGLSLALDDFGDVPLIVRSSSLLEDQAGAAFAGKYKSLFIANKGSKEKRLNALMDAITEVFASQFGPDPIEYRIEHGLIDQHEEMGILIQEVVGKQIGDYFFPAFAGVAFCNNEFRWSGRIKREDGLIRLVAGLGTRAVDRLADDYPVLVAPGQPGLRVNVSADEIVYYSPKKMDVINLKTRRFETIDIQTFFKKYGEDVPLVNQMVSVIEQDDIQIPSIAKPDFEKDKFIISFEGLFIHSPFLKQVRAILNTLQRTFDHPVDIEFAHDGVDFYLLQCRAQSSGELNPSAVIPHGIPHEKIIFSASRFVSNSKVPQVKYIVYVDPQKYGELSKFKEMVAVGRIVGKLNQILPRRQFILIGPGRWGSRGDITLGVNVTYSDINNTAMLIEIARRKKDYLPELSFGTHFFQDLVEANISYLPLYPDDANIVFNEDFLTQSQNSLQSFLPESASLAGVIHVIDVPAVSSGQILQVLTNADSDEAIAFLSDPVPAVERKRN